jgi:hypothetical protein
MKVPATIALKLRWEDTPNSLVWCWQDLVSPGLLNQASVPC